MSLESVLFDTKCGLNSDLCCLANGPTYAKFLRWLSLFGRETTKQLIDYACKCKTLGITPPPAKGGGGIFHVGP